MRFLVRFIPTDGAQKTTADATRAIARSLGVDARNPKRTSYGALELDLFAPSRGDVDVFLAAVSPLMTLEFITDLNGAPRHRPDEESLAEARALFNAERYWECHEVLEGLWRTKEGQERRLLQGMILVCAAHVHEQKGEHPVAVGILKRAIGQLSYPGGRYHGVDVDALARDARIALESGSLTPFSI